MFFRFLSKTMAHRKRCHANSFEAGLIGFHQKIENERVYQSVILDFRNFEEKKINVEKKTFMFKNFQASLGIFLNVHMLKISVSFSANWTSFAIFTAKNGHFSRYFLGFLCFYFPICPIWAVPKVF